jgi:hypothetical protein
VERVEGGWPRGGEEEGGGSGQRGGKGGGAATTIGRRGGRLGLGRGAPIHRIEIKGPNTLSHLSSRPQRKKCQKIYYFPEECLLKLQTPMPQNMKEKRKRNLTSFQKIGISQRRPRRWSSRQSPTPDICGHHRPSSCSTSSFPSSHSCRRPCHFH